MPRQAARASTDVTPVTLENRVFYHYDVDPDRGPTPAHYFWNCRMYNGRSCNLVPWTPWADRQRQPRGAGIVGDIADTGLILACMGCCCGHPDRGGPKTAPGTLKRQMRRAFREARLDGLRLAFTDCLGPCSEANVVFLYAHGRPFWLRRINTVEAFQAVLAWAGEVAAGGPTPLPTGLAPHGFAWTGGGLGPAPPVDG